MSERLKIILNYILIGAIFTDAFVFDLPPFYYVSFYHVAFLLGIPILCFFMRKIKLNKCFLTIYAVLIFLSLFNIIHCENNLLSMFKQSLGLLIHSTFFYMLIKFNNENIKKLFSIYLQIAFIVALIGIIQQIAYWLYCIPGETWDAVWLFRFNYFFPELHWNSSYCQFGLRVNSILPEPASLCLVTFPAFFVSLYSIISNKQSFLSKTKSRIIILAFILTYSIIGFVGLFISLIFLLKKCVLKRKTKFLIPFLFIALTFFFLSISDVRIKLTQFKKVFSNEVDWQKTNQTTYTFIRNALVTFDVMKDNPVFGHGIGSRFTSFKKHTRKKSIADPRATRGIGILNMRDGNSLLLRLLSETGFLGSSIFLFFIFYNYATTKKYGDNHLSIINNSIFILFILRLIRQGNYFSEGFFFFFWLYYFSKIKIRKLKCSNT